jgi:hypothetical protein
MIIIRRRRRRRRRITHFFIPLHHQTLLGSNLCAD